MPGGMRRTERRKWERLPLAIPTFVRTVDPRGRATLDFATILNIGREGALLAIRRHLHTSSHLSLEIPTAPMPAPSTLPPAVWKLQAKVTRVTPLEDGSIVGVRFKQSITTMAKSQKYVTPLGTISHN